MTNENDPANPVIHIYMDGSTDYCMGMTKREAFAMAALQGLNAANGVSAFNVISAVKQADDLIKELNG